MNMASPLPFDSLEDLSNAVRRGQASAVEVTKAYLDRITALDKDLGCFLRVDAEGALEQAAAVDARVKNGEAAAGGLALCGVPVGLKDALCTRGLETSCASKILAGWVPPYDATVVERLRRAGAVVLGKLNMDEFAMGSSNENSAYFPCHNPWDPSRVPGGSSGGSAAAVAASLCAVALGSDTGGSIRQPAALCGVVGLKPTYGRVSRYGLVAFASSLDQVGPLCRTVEDAALMLAVIGGYDPHDSTSIPEEQPDYLAACRQPLKGLRIGLPVEYFRQGPKGLDPQIEAAVREALALLVREGAKLVEVSLPHTPHAVAAYYLIATAEASSNLARYDGVRYGRRELPQPADLSPQRSALFEMYCRTRAAGFGPEVKRRILLGTYVLRSGYYDAYYRRASQIRTLVRRDFLNVFSAGSCDVIATPTSPSLAFRLGERTTDPLSMYLADIYTISCNLAGLPGLSLPCGFGVPPDGQRPLPIGLQFLGPPLGEAGILRVAANYQRLTDWHRRRPMP
jgi:aspartyl-tRNA(Asn)/glutamyl-tRNA(Gln) amidotransferase subunit A